MRTSLPVLRSFLCFLLLGALAGGNARAQKADEIIAQSLKAQGGRGALSKVRTIALEGTFPGSENHSGTFTLYVKSPNRYYLELFTENHPVIEAYNGKSAWHQDAAGAVSTLLGQANAELEATSQFYNSHLLDLKKAKIAAAYVGASRVDGRDALQVELTTVAGLKRELFFDAQSHLLLKQSALVDGVTEELSFSDYRPEAGVQLPRAIVLRRGAVAYNIALHRVAINGSVGERVFDFPQKSQVQLPDLKALFKEIDEHQKAIDKIKENYAGSRVEDQTQYESDGRIKKHEVNEYTFFYLDGDEISTLVKKDGKSLDADAQLKENQKTQKEIENIQRRQSKKDAKEEKEKEEGKDSDSDDPGIEVFLRACQFVNPRRERFRGQDVLVFDFEPNPDFKAHKLAEKVVQKLAGVIWIDEKAHDVARLEAYFVGDMKFGGGLLANLQKGTSFVQEQEFVNNEVWLPTYLEAHVGVRFLMVKGIKINEVTHYFDYKKFNVETLSTIGKPKEASPAESNPQAKPDPAPAAQPPNP